MTKEMELFIRAFWRRIAIHKDGFDKELPKEMPVEFKWAASVAEFFHDKKIQEQKERILHLEGLYLAQQEEIRDLRQQLFTELGSTSS